MGGEGFINKEIWAGRIYLILVRELSDTNNNHKKTEDPLKGHSAFNKSTWLPAMSKLTLIQKFY